MRKKTDDELETLSESLKTWHKEEFGEDIIKTQIVQLLANEREKRIEAFLFRRLSHLLDEDFIKFIEIFKGGKEKK